MKIECQSLIRSTRSSSLRGGGSVDCVVPDVDVDAPGVDARRYERTSMRCKPIPTAKLIAAVIRTRNKEEHSICQVKKNGGRSERMSKKEQERIGMKCSQFV